MRIREQYKVGRATIQKVPRPLMMSESRATITA